MPDRAVDFRLQMNLRQVFLCIFVASALLATVRAAPGITLPSCIASLIVLQARDLRRNSLAEAYGRMALDYLVLLILVIAFFGTLLAFCD